MIRSPRSALFGVLLCLVALGPARAADGGPAQTPDPRRQVLVLMKTPPQHYRPNAEYGGDYGDGQGRGARRRIAGRIAREHGLTLVSDWPLPLVGVDCYVMAVPPDQSPDEVAARLSHDPGVAWSQPLNVYHAQGAQGLGEAQGVDGATPNDPLYRVQPAAREWRLADLHEISTGRNVRVAVIDSMVERTHPDLLGQIQVSENFVADRAAAPEQHGTGVAGIIAALADNGLGIAGVAPHARLMALRACWQLNGPPVSTVCDSLSLAKAVHFAIAHNAQVINLSLSGPPDPLLGRLLDVALERGVTVVGAFDHSLPDGGFPASHSGVVAVAEESVAATPAGVFRAPGRDVPTSQPGGRWFLVSGSSYAAAHVSGLFALLRERTQLTQNGASLVTLPPGGAIDACATLLRASGPCNCACSRTRQSSAIVRQ